MSKVGNHKDTITIKVNLRPLFKHVVET